MPVINWIGKDKVLNHDKELPFKVLKPVKELSVGENSENLLIEGDNLEALKALMPFYYNKVKCIYIDPPYNTGSEKWVYNDKVNSPHIKKWLHTVVGIDDLERHDKWLSMMYPRLKLLKQLLADDGVIFVSIDENEAHHLKMIMDEIFGDNNMVAQIAWKNRYNAAKEKHLAKIHEYILFYAKDLKTLPPIYIPTNEKYIKRYFKLRDNKFEIRGPYRLQPLEAGKSMDERKNLVFSIKAPDGTVINPKRQWKWEKDRILKAIEKGEIDFKKTKDGWSLGTKQYLKDENGKEYGIKPFSLIDEIYNQEGTREIEKLFGSVKSFPFPKPLNLIKHLIYISQAGNNDIVLDSFAGSGTTGQAVLELNKKDKINRKFILVELENNIATKITAKRLTKTIKGYKGAIFEDGTKQDFQYLRLNGELYGNNGFINPDAKYEDLAGYIYFTETKNYLDLKTIKNPYIGSLGSTDFFLFYEGRDKNFLDEKTIKKVSSYKGKKVIYADKCLLDEEYLEMNKVIFKQIPYELKKY